MADGGYGDYGDYGGEGGGDYGEEGGGDYGEDQFGGEYDAGDYGGEYGGGYDIDGDAAAGAGGPPDEAVVIGMEVLGRQVSYQVEETDAVDRRRAALVRSVAETLDLSFEDALMLLRSTNYNDRRLQERYFEEPEKCLEAAGIKEPGAKDPADFPEDMPDEGVLCESCWGEYPKTDMDGGPCGHFFCKGCWQGHFRGAAAEKARLLDARCMSGCGQRCTERLYQTYCTPDDWAKYQRWDLGTFIDARGDAKSCPNPKCGHVVVYPKGSVRDVHCTCGKVWCYGCGKDAHEPASCHDAAEWRKRNQDEDMNMQWVLSNTRPCPKCSMPIEKNQGCSHMVCGKHAHGGKIVPGSGCGCQFCWICMQPYDNHKNCTPWKPENAKSRDKAGNDLAKFVNVVSKYDHNIKAIGFAKKLIPETLRAMTALQQLRALKLEEVEHLRAAIDEVAEGCRILAFTYVFQFYHEDHPALRLLSEHQTELAKELEALQGMIEGRAGIPGIGIQYADAAAPTGEDRVRFMEDRQRIIDATRAVSRFRMGVVQAVQNADAVA